MEMVVTGIFMTAGTLVMCLLVGFLWMFAKDAIP